MTDPESNPKMRLVYLFLAASLPALVNGQSFDVATIKVNTTTVNGNRSINWAPGGQLNCVNVPLRMLMQFAYDLRDYQFTNLPGWADTEGYDIIAKPSPEAVQQDPPPNSQAAMALLRQRTQALIAERFGLALHTEEREMPIFTLVVAKGGPKLGEGKPADNLPTRGPDGPQMSWNNTRVICKNCTMQRFCDGMLSARMRRTVIDKTGLTGAYEFKMEFVPDEVATKASAETDTTGPSFLTALQEQLGLRLEAGRGSVKILVVDKLEKPSAN
jgi:uncharacterized protein (TIGR03435 family)